MPSPSLAMFAALLTVVATGALQMAGAAEPPAEVSFVESFLGDAKKPEGLVTAIGMRATPATEAAPPADVVILVDTSASQTGEHRRRALDAVAGLLEAARPTDRFLAATVDVTCTPLADGFQPAVGDALRTATRSLDARTPLGSTDLIGGLEAAAALFGEGQSPRAVVYIGDGPGIAGTDPQDFARVIDLLRTKRISVSSLGIGPQVNWPCLASLASATGGMLLVPGDEVAAKDVGAKIGGLAVKTVNWPTDVALSGGAGGADVRLMPSRMPPLRADRESIVLVEGPLHSGRLDMTLRSPGGSPRATTLDVAAAPARDENAFLAELARNGRESDGIFLPLLGREGLELARSVIRGEAATLAMLSRQAEATGAHESARRLAAASLRRDPDNSEAAVILAAARAEAADGTAGAGGPPEPGWKPPATAPRDEDGTELAEIEAMRTVRGQQLEQETAVRIREARQLLASDPDRARDLLKEAQVLVSRSDDLDAGSRDRLLRQLEMRIRESIVRSREKVDRDLASERRAAIGRERMRLNDELQRREERIKQLVERYNALVEVGIRDGYAQPEYYPAVIKGEAVLGFEQPTTALVQAEREVGEELQKEAPNLWAGYPIPMTARVIGRTAPLVARMLEYDTENVRTRRDQQRGFMDMMHTVDVAAIPFPDEPPIVYPTAARWRELSELRKKYKSVDLANPTENEKRIYESLEQPVTRTFDFQETPLRAAITQLQDEFNIPILPDMPALTDAGIDLDATTVTQKLSGVSLRSALRLLLRDAGLTYLVKDEVLLITTAEKAKENLVVKVYPVADLVLPVNPSGGLNPFQTGGGLGGSGSVNSGQGAVGGQGGMGGGGGGLGGFCWVAREVYGPHDPRWLVFRNWMTSEAPTWLRQLYATHGPACAEWIRDKPALKAGLRLLMDRVVEPRIHAASTQEIGGHFQVAEARARVARSDKPDATPTAAGTDIERESQAARSGGPDDRIGLPQAVLEAEDVRAAVTAYLSPAGRTATDGKPGPAAAPADERGVAMRMAQMRISAADLGKAGRFDRAAELISAAISCGHCEPWMYESLALAMEAAGKPRADVERALLSSADFAAGPVDLLQLAHYLARFGSDRQAIRICRQVTRLDPANREAFALAMTIAARGEDLATLRWACPGVLAHEWPADQRDVATRAARLARASIESLAKAGQKEEAVAFQADMDRALVRDFVLELSWTGDADVDLVVEEPPGTVCSAAAPRSTSGGVVLPDSTTADAGVDPVNTVHREQYVATEAFPGTYRMLVRRSFGKVAADTVTAETVINRGTPQEQRQRQQIRLGADDSLIVVNLDSGRRREPLLDAKVAQDVVVQRQIGKTVLAQQLSSLADPETAASLSSSRSGPQAPSGGPGLPFFRNGQVGYQPVITTLPEGLNMFARAVVSADRRYVRITATPLFSGVGQVSTFNYVSGATGNSGGGQQGGGQAGGGQQGGGGLGGGGQQAGGGLGGGGQQAGGGAGGIGGGQQGGLCWVAREVYGSADPRWMLFRGWLLDDAPDWLRHTYAAHGERFAAWIHDKPAVKAVIRLLMDRAIANRATVPCPRSE